MSDAAGVSRSDAVWVPKASIDKKAKEEKVPLRQAAQERSCGLAL